MVRLSKKLGGVVFCLLFIAVITSFFNSFDYTQSNSKSEPPQTQNPIRREITIDDNRSSFVKKVERFEYEKYTKVHEDIHNCIQGMKWGCSSIRKGHFVFTGPSEILTEKVEGKLENIASKCGLSLPQSDNSIDATIKKDNLKRKEKNEESLKIGNLLGLPNEYSTIRFSEVEFQCYSQNTEDGILLYIFLLIGVTNKRVVEVCSGLGFENNAAFLITQFGFEGILMDGDEGNTKIAKQFFDLHPSTKNKPPVIVNTFITAENINDLIKSNGFEGEIDLFSLDIDGIDYWIWDSIHVVNPRVVIVEIQEVWGWTETKTRPYRADHVSRSVPEMGASILAFIHLAKTKNYRLIGCIEAGFNAIFLRNDIGQDIFGDSYDPKGCFGHWTKDWSLEIESRKISAKQFDWVDPRITNRAGETKKN